MIVLTCGGPVRTLALLAVSGAVALALGLAVPGSWVYPLLHHSGYYVIAAAFAVWVFFLCLRLGQQPWTKRKSACRGLALSASVVILLFSTGLPKFKVLSDEANLIGVSLAMFEDRVISLPVQNLNLAYADFNPEYVPNKRPLLFPFLVSVVHGVAGYNASHGLVVNFICSIVVLWTIFAYLGNYYSDFHASIGVLLFVSLPVFPIWITSSGFETLNLMMMVLLFYFVDDALRNREAPSSDLIVWTLLLLSQCRYESTIFIVIVLLIVPYLGWRSFLQKLSPMSCLAPLFMLPVIWQRRFFWGYSEPLRKDMQLIETAGQGFGLENLVGNLGKNITVLSGVDPQFGFNVVVMALSVLGAWMLARQLVLKETVHIGPPPGVTLMGIITSIVMLGIYSFYRWGNFLDPVANRMAVVFAPLMVVAATHFLYIITNYRPAGTRLVIVLVCMLNLVFLMPFSQKETIIRNLSLTYEYNRVVDYLKRNFDEEGENILIISDRPNLYLVHDMGSVTFAYANQHAGEIAKLMRSYYDRVLVLQRTAYETGRVLPGTAISPAYKLEKRHSIKSSHLHAVDVFEVTGIVTE